MKEAWIWGGWRRWIRLALWNKFGEEWPINRPYGFAGCIQNFWSKTLYGQFSQAWIVHGCGGEYVKLGNGCNLTSCIYWGMGGPRNFGLNRGTQVVFSSIDMEIDCIRRLIPEERHWYPLSLSNEEWQTGQTISHDLNEVWGELQEIEKLSGMEEDRVIWTASSHGRFTTKSAWEVIKSHGPMVDWHQVIWFNNNIPKHSFMGWRVMTRR